MSAPTLARATGTGQVITRWSAVAPFGYGRAAFADGVRRGLPTAVDVDPDRWQVPDRQVCLVPDFDVAAVLGRKGTRSLDRGTALALTAVGSLLGDAEGPAVDTGAGTGLVLGTTMGSTRSTMGFTRSSLTAEKPFYVDPAQFPNTVMNCAAGRCAIWYSLTGPNTTIAAGRTAGISAMAYGRRLIGAGRAAKVLVGGYEEYSNERSWLGHHLAGGAPTVHGEGCAVLLVEPATSAGGYGEPLAEVPAAEAGFRPDGDVGRAVRDRAAAVLDRAGARPGEVWAACGTGASDPASATEAAVLTELFGSAATGRVPADLLGDTAAATVPFRIAGALAVAEHDRAARGALVLVSAVDPDGSAGAVLLRLAG